MFEIPQFPIVVQTSLNHSSHFLQNMLHPANLEVATWCDAEIAKLYLLNEKLQPLVLWWLNNLPSFLRVRQPIIVRTRFLVLEGSLWFKKGLVYHLVQAAATISKPCQPVTLFFSWQYFPYVEMPPIHLWSTIIFPGILEVFHQLLLYWKTARSIIASRSVFRFSSACLVGSSVTLSSFLHWDDGFDNEIGLTFCLMSASTSGEDYAVRPWIIIPAVSSLGP